MTHVMSKISRPGIFALNLLQTTCSVKVRTDGHVLCRRLEEPILTTCWVRHHFHVIEEPIQGAFSTSSVQKTVAKTVVFAYFFFKILL